MNAKRIRPILHLVAASLLFLSLMSCSQESAPTVISSEFEEYFIPKEGTSIQLNTGERIVIEAGFFENDVTIALSQQKASTTDQTLTQIGDTLKLTVFKQTLNNTQDKSIVIYPNYPNTNNKNIFAELTLEDTAGKKASYQKDLNSKEIKENGIQIHSSDLLATERINNAVIGIQLIAK